MPLRNRRRFPGAGSLWQDLERLKGLLENPEIGNGEALRILEALEDRLAWVEEDNRSYRVLFENLISVLEEEFQPEEVRALIRHLGLREILLKRLPPETESVH